MQRRWRLLFVGIGLSGLSGWALGGDLLCRGRCLRNYCYLPGYDYQIVPAQKSRVVTVVSDLTADKVDVILSSLPMPSDIPSPKVKRFQFVPRAEARVDHCSLNQIAVTLVEDGTWTVNFRAEQNPQSVPIAQQPTVVRYRRNQFFVELRGIGLAQEVAIPKRPVLGKPAHFRKQFESFWIEQGRTEQKKFEGYDPDVRRYFQQIDRIEMDLSYE